jgi:chemotaxis protein MotA
MNKSLLTGVLFGIGTLWFGVFESISNPKFYMDPHALILVLGGTLSASLIAYPYRQLITLGDTLLTWFIRKKTPDYRVVEELYEVSIQYMKYKNLASSLEFTHPFINEGFMFIVSDSYSLEQIQDILVKRIVAFRKKMQNDGKILTAISKYPPAFGLLGASTGMISMMLNLNGGGTQKIGSSMAVALVATFWGVCIANLIFLPLSDFANKIAQDEAHTRMIIMEGLILIKKNEQPLMIAEILKSHLHPADRKKVRVLKDWPEKENTEKSANEDVAS